MIQDLNSLLGWIGDKSPRGQFILAVDSQTDGTFTIHHFLSTFVRNHHRVIFISLAQSFAHYNSVAQKLGTNLAAEKADGNISHIDGLQFSLQLYSEGSTTDAAAKEKVSVFTECVRCGSLRPLYETVSDALGAHLSNDPSVAVSIVVDDLSLLLSLGVGVRSVVEFVHYCGGALNRLPPENAGNLVSLVHDDGDVDDDSSLLATTLSHRADLLIRVEGLTSGFSKDVHGQLSVIHRSPDRGTPGGRKKNVVHYKILDKTVSFFAIGTSTAVL